MHRRDFLRTPLALSMSGFVGPSFADDSRDGRGGRFDDDLISHLEGRWSITREIRGTTVNNVMTAEWVLAHQFLQLHMKDLSVPSRYEALVLIGYVYASGEYVAHWTDTFGGKFSAVGRGARKNDAVEFRFEYPDGLFFNTFDRDASNDTWRMRLENQEADGRRSLFAVDTLQRSG